MHPPVNHAAGIRQRRTRLLAIAALVVVAGLATHFLWRGPMADLTGDALYAVMVYLVFAFALPDANRLLIGAAALTACVVVELFQLTGLPGLWAQDFWPVGLLLGAGFDARDLLAYGVGAGVAATCDLAFGRRRRDISRP